MRLFRLTVNEKPHQTVGANSLGIINTVTRLSLKVYSLPDPGDMRATSKAEMTGEIPQKNHKSV